MMLRKILLRCAVLVFACLPAVGYCAGPLLLIGGGLKDDNAAIYQKLIQLAGGSGQARIGVITAASIPESEDPDAGTPEARNARSNGEFYAALSEAGRDRVQALLHEGHYQLQMPDEGWEEGLGDDD